MIGFVIISALVIGFSLTNNVSDPLTKDKSGMSDSNQDMPKEPVPQGKKITVTLNDGIGIHSQP